LQIINETKLTSLKTLKERLQTLSNQIRKLIFENSQSRGAQPAAVRPHVASTACMPERTCNLHGERALVKSIMLLYADINVIYMENVHW